MRLAFLMFGHTSLALGFLGVFLPVLPTTPFVLLSAYCYSRSSREFHQRLLEHRRFGPLIQDWQAHGVVRPKAKALSVFLIGLTFGYLIVFRPFAWGWKVFFAGLALCLTTFLLSRPSSPAAQEVLPSSEEPS